MNKTGKFIFKNDMEKILNHLNEDKHQNIRELGKIEEQQKYIRLERVRQESQDYNDMVFMENNVQSINKDLENFSKNIHNDISKNEYRDIFEELCNRDRIARTNLLIIQTKNNKNVMEYSKKHMELMNNESKIKTNIRDIQERIEKIINESATEEYSKNDK